MCSVAVDVGNTAVKLAVRQDDRIVDHWIVIDETTPWQQSAIQWVRDRLGCSQTQWKVASVHRSAAQSLVDAVVEIDPKAPIHLVTYHDVPMAVDVRSPQQLGIDRLLSAFAAHQQWDSPVIVADAGSAVTVDWVDAEGSFRGGAIFPGLMLQARALATGTDALTEVDWPSSQESKLPGRNTSDAIHCGILVGVAAAIDRIADEYAKLSDEEGVTLVLTGGDREVISRHLTRKHHCAANLVCRGLLSLTSS